jgi:hypothetical protein
MLVSNLKILHTKQSMLQLDDYIGNVHLAQKEMIIIGLRFSKTFAGESLRV